MFRRMALISVAGLVLAAACGGGASPAGQVTPVATPNATATPAQVATKVLASGSLDSIPGGALFVNYMDLPQAPAGSIKHQHIAGFVYTVQGMHEMDVEGAAPLMIHADEAAFVGAAVVHSHVNTGTTANDWWFVGLRPVSSRPLAILPGQKELYTTADLTQVTPGTYTETLSESRLSVNAVDRQGGSSLRVIFVIEGGLTVSGDATTAGTMSADQAAYAVNGANLMSGDVATTRTISAGQGAYALPGANLVLTAGTTGARYLAFILTPAK